MAHKIIERSLMAVCDLNKRFAEMMTHSALSGISDADMPLLQGKLEVAANMMHSNTDRLERNFERVISISGLSSPYMGETRIDAEKLLKIRESAEYREFRAWLAGTDSLSDKELKDRVAGLESRIRRAVNSKVGKAIRFVVSNGLSMIPPPVGAVAGMTASAIDSFVLEMLAPKDAIVIFLSESYPSLFKHSK